MASLAIISCPQFLTLPPDEQLLVDELENLSFQVKVVSWDDPQVDWSQFQMGIIRATWDYFLRLPEFLSWAEEVSQQLDLWNPLKLIRWNTDKHYLQDLERLGFPIVPTAYLYPEQSDLDIPSLAREKGWAEIVIKPVVSAGSHRTYRTKIDEFSQVEKGVVEAQKEHPIMVQPYLSSVETKGETSVIFIHQEGTHALKKLPQKGDFRSQEQFGSQLIPVEIPEPEGELSWNILSNLDPTPLYSRFDYLYDEEGKPLLNELEIVEPSLFFLQGPQAAKKMAQVILKISQELT